MPATKFEDALARLETIVNELEKGDLPLNDSLLGGSLGAQTNLMAAFRKGLRQMGSQGKRARSIKGKSVGRVFDREGDEPKSRFPVSICFSGLTEIERSRRVQRLEELNLHPLPTERAGLGFR